MLPLSNKLKQPSANKSLNGIGKIQLNALNVHTFMTESEQAGRKEVVNELSKTIIRFESQLGETLGMIPINGEALLKGSFVTFLLKP